MKLVSKSKYRCQSFTVELRLIRPWREPKLLLTRNQVDVAHLPPEWPHRRALERPGGRRSTRAAEAASRSEAGSRRAPRRHRYRPGTVALQEIRRFQKTWNLLIPAAPFIRTVKEISNFYAPEIGRWTAEALTALQEVSSTMLQRIFWFICLKMQCCVQFMQSVLH
ncbi:histone H3-like centromeric protein CENH3 isoform X3 [Malania oleifera]|uniref:histone H3-like centromeric protein CENH3 isoform X3 n=1 Tax=Malania oleifera TaxID=397392 RepID=UPI0025ADD72B|nr:histone H3-like centromeric protein CENH3 isoform X3 [Malania oleifera]